MRGAVFTNNIIDIMTNRKTEKAIKTAIEKSKFQTFLRPVNVIKKKERVNIIANPFAQVIWCKASTLPSMAERSWKIAKESSFCILEKSVICENIQEENITHTKNIIN